MALQILPKCFGATVLMISAGAVNAVQFNAGEWAGAFDTTATYGLSVRAKDPDPVNAAGQYGNRNFDQWDVFSNQIKISHDLQLQKDALSVFLRGNYFYDFALADEDLKSAAENRAVSHGDITDAFLLYQFGPGQIFTARIGKQVISWGENTFIGGALNDINTVDVSKLRQPGVELKDSLLGTPAIDLSWSVSNNLSLEGFYLFAFDEIKIDPSGTFFSTAEFPSDGGGGVPGTPLFSSPNLTPDSGPCPGSTCFLTTLGPLQRASDNLARNGGQWGLSLHYFIPGFALLGANGLDLGAYYQNVHDHVPAVSVIAGRGQFFLDYPEDVERFGVSFNTLFRGWAVGGEYSYRRNAPYQSADILAVGLGLPIGTSATAVAAPSKMGGFAPGTKVKAWERIERNQIQMTGQRTIGRLRSLKADDSSVIGEIAYGWVNLPSKNAFNPLNPATNNYWGFQVRGDMTYNRALFGVVNVIPGLAFRWDVDGVSSEPAGLLMVEDRKSATVSMTFEYKLDWRAQISYTDFWGGENLGNSLTGGRLVSDTDRDFISANISYSF